MRFANRQEAGRLLAATLRGRRWQSSVVYALPRGGVVQGAAVARAIGAPLDLVVVHKIGHPLAQEYALCAVAETGHMAYNESEALGMDPAWLTLSILDAQEEAKRLRRRYLPGTNPVEVDGDTAIIVDDGIATGLSTLAAIKSIRARQAKRIILAVPVIPRDILGLLEQNVDDVVSLEVAQPYLGSVGAYYDQFPPVSDNEVTALLTRPSS